MKRFILVFGLLLSSAVNAQVIDREFLQNRPLWYSEDGSEIIWMVARNGMVAGHRAWNPSYAEGMNWSFFEFPEGLSEVIDVPLYSVDTLEPTAACIRLTVLEEDVIDVMVSIAGCFSVGSHQKVHPH